MQKKIQLVAKCIDRENLKRALGTFGLLMATNVEMLTELETRDRFGCEDSSQFDLAYSSVLEELKTLKLNNYGNLIEDLKNGGSNGARVEKLLLQRVVDFGNLAWGIKARTLLLREIYDSLTSDKQLILLETIIKPTITAEIADRFKSDVATIVNRSIERKADGTWKEADAVAYFERFEYFLLCIQESIEIFGLEDEYYKMMKDALAMVQNAKRQIYIQTQGEWDISREKLLEFQRVRAVSQDGIVGHFTISKVIKNVDRVKEIIDAIPDIKQR